MAVSMKMKAFWDREPYNFIIIYRIHQSDGPDEGGNTHRSSIFPCQYHPTMVLHTHISPKE
jgi:hypothetical protein